MLKHLCERCQEVFAPRDSALNAKIGRSEDGLPVVNFDREALHEKAPRDSAPVTENDVAASCFGVTPRDSGKEST